MKNLQVLWTVMTLKLQLKIHGYMTVTWEDVTLFPFVAEIFIDLPPELKARLHREHCADHRATFALGYNNGRVWAES